MYTAAEWLKYLGLTRHPEGGYFREMYRSTETIAAGQLPERFAGPRCFSTAIYFMLVDRDFSALHRIKQDEVWHFYAGSALSLHVIEPDGRYYTAGLGPDILRGESFQVVVKAGAYFGAELSTRPAGTAGPAGAAAAEGAGEAGDIPAASAYALVGCTVAPGFDYADFELPGRGTLHALYPQHKALIDRLTRA